MKIISSFKDYYDYVAGMYGGGDPKITYHRKRMSEIEPSTSFAPPLILDSIKAQCPHFPQDSFFRNIAEHITYEYRWLCVCGKIYLVVWRVITGPFLIGQKPTILNQKDHLAVYERITQKPRYSWNRTRSTWWALDEPIGLEISKKIREPVFTFRESGRSIVVDSEIPRLSEIGFPAFESPEQLYQNISYFMANTINDSPDMMPRTHMSDKERIVQHGFDLKQSFRHRK